MREPEGYMSWQHLTFVSCLVVLMITLAVFWEDETEVPNFPKKTKSYGLPQWQLTVRSFLKLF